MDALWGECVGQYIYIYIFFMLMQFLFYFIFMHAMLDVVAVVYD